MPTEAENAQYLYTVLTANGPPTVDWNAVAKDLELKLGATTKRWSRLQQAFRDGKDPGPTAYQFLWSCSRHSTRDAPSLPWGEIAKKFNTTPGAASKRYSRMKLAYERGDDASPTKGKGKSTGTSKNAGTDSATAVKDRNLAGGAGSKRKRGPTTTTVKKAITKVETSVKLEPSSDATNDEAPIAKPKTKSKLKPTPRTRGTKSTSKDDAQYKPSTSASPSEDEQPALKKKKKKLSAQNKPRPAIKPSTNSAPVESPEPVKPQTPFYPATTPERENANRFPCMISNTEKPEGYGRDKGTLADRVSADDQHEDGQCEDQGKEDEYEVQAKTSMRSSDLPFPWDPSHAWGTSAAPTNDMLTNANSMLADPEVENDGLVAAWLDDVRVDEGAEILDEFLDIVG